MRRRQFLAGSVATATLLAGCGGASGGNSTGDGTSTVTTGTDAGGASGGGFTLPDHPALDGIGSQPTLGPPPGEAPGLIVAFEDPSCPTCATFESRVVPEIRANLVDPEKATFVFRSYPVIYPWGEPATHALEATFATDEAAFWDLLAHYFDNQDTYRGLDDSAVFDRTEAHLAETTALDATAILDRARNGDADAAVTSDLEAGQAAGAGRVTPHLFLFANGEYLTKASGSISYSVIESALGV